MKPLRALAEIATIVQGGRTGQTGNDFVASGFPAYGAGGLNGMLSTYEFDCEAIILSAIGARCGKCFYVAGKWVSLANTQIIIPDASIADVRFLWHQLNDESSWPRSGTAQPFIKPSDVKRRTVFLPPLVEQKRIATILDKTDNLRRKRQESIQLANELLISKFEETFGNPHTNAKGFPTISLGELVKLKSGNFLPSHEMAGTGGVHVYGGNGINGEHDTAMFEEVKLVIGRVGAYCGAVHLTKPRSWITDNALYVSEISPKVRLEYLAFALNLANLNQYSSRSGQPLVSASRLYPVKLVLPPLSLQDVFLEIVDRTTRFQASQINSLEVLEEMSRSLASELFT